MAPSEEWLLLTVVLAGYGAGNVWPVQVSSYPLFGHVGQREFHAYHAAWWRSIWVVILAPACLLVVASMMLLHWRPAGVPPWELWLGVGLQLALVLGTAVWWGPLMARLGTVDGGLDEHRFAMLLRTHWIRVGIVTMYGVLSVWMLAQNTWLAHGR